MEDKLLLASDKIKSLKEKAKKKDMMEEMENNLIENDLNELAELEGNSQSEVSSSLKSSGKSKNKG